MLSFYQNLLKFSQDDPHIISNKASAKRLLDIRSRTFHEIAKQGDLKQPQPQPQPQSQQHENETTTKEKSQRITKARETMLQRRLKTVIQQTAQTRTPKVKIIK